MTIECPIRVQGPRGERRLISEMMAAICRPGAVALDFVCPDCLGTSRGGFCPIDILACYQGKLFLQLSKRSHGGFKNVNAIGVYLMPSPPNYLICVVWRDNAKGSYDQYAERGM